MQPAAKQILGDNVVGSIATINSDGSPWVTPVHIFSDEAAVYWFSMEDKQHSVNIERDPRVSLTLFSPDATRGTKGVYINGHAERLDPEATASAKQLMAAKIGLIIPPLKEATGYKLPIGQFNETKSTGNCWYFYSENI